MCGQALSHCVNFTVRHIVAHWQEIKKPLKNMYILEDGAFIPYFLASLRLLHKHMMENLQVSHFRVAIVVFNLVLYYSIRYVKYRFFLQGRPL